MSQIYWVTKLEKDSLKQKLHDFDNFVTLLDIYILIFASMTPLLQRYNQAVPRYTSYPAVPHWNTERFELEAWKKAVIDAYQKNQKLALYLHLPFCENLCTYCGCNKRITKNHQVESPYIAALLAEWAMYHSLFGEPPFIEQLHLGGGTPTFFSAESLDSLMKGIFSISTVSSSPDFSIEIHPNYTKEDQLIILYKHGFRRLSVGIQDFDTKVQKAINRMQPYSLTAAIFSMARDIGYEGVNADMVYGLPFQHLKGLQETLDKVMKLQPDRIAYYSYAHVPWISKSQRHFSETDLPDPSLKQALADEGRRRFIDEGYIPIGFDHFALPHDPLALAQLNGTLHRNFMGFTHHQEDLLIGLGVSSISDAGTAFAQNEKEVEPYLQKVGQGIWPLIKGHLHSEEDLQFREHVLNLMCQYQTQWQENDPIKRRLAELQSFQNDGLVTLSPGKLELTPLGRRFVRNVCYALDPRSEPTENSGKSRFSAAV